jgi:hypothetical protein
MLPIVLDSPLSPVYLGFEDTQHYFLVDSSENFSDHIQEVLSALTTVIQHIGLCPGLANHLDHRASTRTGKEQPGIAV